MAIVEHSHVVFVPCKFAEDQVIQVPLLAVLWLSIDAKHKPLSGLKVRQWAAQLLSRSILLGSSTDGVAMVREQTNVHNSQSINRVINYSFFCLYALYSTTSFGTSLLLRIRPQSCSSASASFRRHSLITALATTKTNLPL